MEVAHFGGGGNRPLLAPEPSWLFFLMPISGYRTYGRVGIEELLPRPCRSIHRNFAIGTWLLAVREDRTRSAHARALRRTGGETRW